MTAEIAIMNKYGVALAADSAVTIGNGEKIYNSANKLFELSKYAPIGIMIYGSAEFVGTPWETIIKRYRDKSLNDKIFDTIDDYFNDFLNFLENTDTVFEYNEKDLVTNHIKGIIASIEKEYQKRAMEIFNDEQTRKHANINDVFIDVIKSFITYVNSETAKQSIPKVIIQKFSKQFRKHIVDIYNEAYQNWPKTLFNSLVTASLKSLLLPGFHRSKSGIVIAGFGEKDIFPTSNSCEISARLCGYIVKSEIQQTSVLQDGACIQPFAQREMVDTFIKGVDPSYENFLQTTLESTLLQITDSITNAINKHNPALIQSSNLTGVTETLLKSIQSTISKYQLENYIHPIVNSVGILPLSELAEMARSLISLTSFKRRVSMHPESVGGPIDVAVISKGDGFIWIDRKHYFKAELNPNYFERKKRKEQ